jgi:hypothetical protein
MADARHCSELSAKTAEFSHEDPDQPQPARNQDEDHVEEELAETILTSVAGHVGEFLFVGEALAAT